MSGSAALEYGFPSTHTANAVSVAVYAVSFIRSPDTQLNPTSRLIFEALFWFYVLSITAGRVYCGMHGFADVIIGGMMGAILSLVQIQWGDTLDQWLYSGDSTVPIIIGLIIVVLVRVHPEPADDCPCFDDSVAFAGVVIGIEVGCWHFARSGWAWDYPMRGTAPFRLEELGWIKTVLRVVIGVAMIVGWREVMKPTLLRTLPPVFRVFENLGLNLPRKFFLQPS
jgi:dihydrosphingosine 1-phosphate phosphatase